MTDETNNVITLEPRKATPPELRHCELRLHDEGRHLSVILLDENGDHVGVLSYGLECQPDGFDLSRLVEAWSDWRAYSSVAR